MDRRRNIFLSGTLLALLQLWHLIYGLRTSVYFSQDDFAVFAYFKQYNFIDLMLKFLTQGDIWGFHKILGFLNFRILFELFGTNHLAFLVNNHIIATANVLLLFGLIYKLSNDYIKALLLSLIFGKLYFYYFSNIHEYLMVLFVLLSANTYLFSKNIFLAVIFFILGLLSKEMAISLPFLLLAISVYQKRKLTPLIPFLAVLLFYLLYQSGFVFGKTNLPTDHPYAICQTVSCWKNNFFYYMDSLTIILLVSTFYLSIEKRSYLLLLVFLLSLTPAVLLANRQESYYFYLPLAYLCIYLAAVLPKFNLRNSILYLAVLMAMGGREILPKIVWQTYPNWQRVSIDRMTERVRNQSDLAPVEIDMSDIVIERDARHLLGSDIVEFFLPEEFDEKYSYQYVIEKKLLVVNKKIDEIE